MCFDVARARRGSIAIVRPTGAAILIASRPDWHASADSVIVEEIGSVEGWGEERRGTAE